MKKYPSYYKYTHTINECLISGLTSYLDHPGTMNVKIKNHPPFNFIQKGARDLALLIYGQEKPKKEK
ncbi:hypothetical protein QJS04_geneDACA008489 [Acorus gramineus]|uniref:Uncharacterized protein n=1 Tax=Acorus gramineus TaxID=55184 RepID=A0AAV9AI82_ACOGR|nr:hypothetical protein QJS04_geneDACA008489 [Acorus gramineus]